MTRKTDLEQNIHASYALNNPLRYAGPCGHYIPIEEEPCTLAEFAVR